MSKLHIWMLNTGGASAFAGMEFDGHDSQQMDQNYTTICDDTMR